MFKAGGLPSLEKRGKIEKSAALNLSAFACFEVVSFCETGKVFGIIA